MNTTDLLRLLRTITTSPRRSLGRRLVCSSLLFTSSLYKETVAMSPALKHFKVRPLARKGILHAQHHRSNTPPHSGVGSQCHACLSLSRTTVLYSPSFVSREVLLDGKAGPNSPSEGKFAWCPEREKQKGRVVNIHALCSMRYPFQKIEPMMSSSSADH